MEIVVLLRAYIRATYRHLQGDLLLPHFAHIHLISLIDLGAGVIMCLQTQFSSAVKTTAEDQRPLQQNVKHNCILSRSSLDISETDFLMLFNMIKKDHTEFTSL